MLFVVISKGFTGGAWILAYNLGLAMLAHKMAPDDPRVFGLIIAAYGVGNLSAALILANQRRRRPSLILFLGYAWMGFGFVMLAVAPSLKLLLAWAAFAAIGGPMNDVPFYDIVQARFTVSDAPKIYRLRLALETASTLLCMLISPILFRLLSVETVVVLCGLVMTGVGVAGLALCPLNREVLEFNGVAAPYRIE
jgi:hypothetical protein